MSSFLKVASGSTIASVGTLGLIGVFSAASAGALPLAYAAIPTIIDSAFLFGGVSLVGQGLD